MIDQPKDMEALPYRGQHKSRLSDGSTEEYTTPPESPTPAPRELSSISNLHQSNRRAKRFVDSASVSSKPSKSRRILSNLEPAGADLTVKREFADHHDKQHGTLLGRRFSRSSHEDNLSTPPSAIPSFASSVEGQSVSQKLMRSFNTDITVPDVQELRKPPSFHGAAHPSPGYGEADKYGVRPGLNGQVNKGHSFNGRSCIGPLGGPNAMPITPCSKLNRHMNASSSTENRLSTRKKSVTRLEQYQVRDLPNQGLFFEDIPKTKLDIPLCLRYECTRVALANAESQLKPEDLLPPPYLGYNDYGLVWNYLKTHPRVKIMPPRGSSAAWEAALQDFNQVNMKGHLIMVPARKFKSVFRLVLDPLELSSTSRRLYRAFGYDRFLHLEVPSLDKMTEGLAGQSEHFARRFLEWLLQNHLAFGRYWRVFFLRSKKKEQSLHRVANEFGHELFLFATHGHDIKLCGVTQSVFFSSGPSSKRVITVAELLNWFIPFDKIGSMTYLKAYSRIELCMFLFVMLNSVLTSWGSIEYHDTYCLFRTGSNPAGEGHSCR